MSNPVKGLTAYLNFMGNCEEALNFYARVLDGKATIRQRYDNPAMNAPEEFRDKVLHASLEFGPVTILASDIMKQRQGTPTSGTGDAALSLDVTDSNEGKRIFDLLAEGGKQGVPFEKQFWGGWHGNLTDRYGVRWMVNCDD